MEKRESNYESMKKKMGAQFAAGDLDAAAREWGLVSKDGFLFLTFVGRDYRIRCSDGAVLYELGGDIREADYNVCMTLYDILSRKRVFASGELQPIRAFSDIHSATVSSAGMFARVTQRFDHRDAELAAACERLGGVPFGKGDVSYRFPVFRDLQAGVQFWNSDEEFGAEMNLLCDKNALQFMHFETMMFMMGHIVGRLGECIP